MASRKHTTPTQLDLSFGPAEEWRPVVDFEGYYEVSNMGRVRSLDHVVSSARWPSRWKKVSGHIVHSKAQQYPRVRLYKDGQIIRESIHILVLTAFVGSRPEGLVCNHIDGNSTNNRVENLEWVTQQRNIQHASERGTLLFGERNKSAKLTTQKVQEIRKLSQEGHAYRALARQFSMSRITIKRIVSRMIWRHVP